ncbi:alpha/beta fold hydrolase [Synechocystis sp. PCC 7509]|uniref:alpha/beta fold hydrolase n=1 Tax=Synechocystis sp. PCC 7509 TaxID=927677 RepID=UPI0002ABF79E|nr:alpha/beta hydrolase [Synechocystis sp. PCC 7509]
MNATLIDTDASKFTHHTANINGVNLHYVRGGQGEPVVLLAGWPQTWYAWRYIMPMLAEHYTVIAVDMRGLGDSDRPADGYDTQTVAKDIYGLVDYLNFEHIFLVGHDVGTWVAYAYAAAYPENVAQLVVLDAAIPGISPDEAFQLSPDSKTWQFVFHAVPDLPEMLTAGREKLYLSWFFKNKSVVSGAISEADIDEYVRCYSAPGAMQAGFAYYRAFFCDRLQNQEYAKTKLKMPVLALGGEKAVGMKMLQTMQLVAQNVTGGIVEGCGHYISEECPDYLTAQLLAFFGQAKPR